MLFFYNHLNQLYYYSYNISLASSCILVIVIQTYLALYCFAGGQHSTSLQLLYRARYLNLLVSGEDHPQVALLDVSETSSF